MTPQRDAFPDVPGDCAATNTQTAVSNPDLTSASENISSLDNSPAVTPIIEAIPPFAVDDTAKSWEACSFICDDEDDDDSQSCDWSVASSESSIFWENDDDDEDDSQSAELDEYLALSMARAEREAAARPRRVKFCQAIVSDVRLYIKPGVNETNCLYYTAHELQQMIDDFVRDGGSKLLG